MGETPPAPSPEPSAAPPFAVVVLAAGLGTRMRSSLPKMLHEVAGRPMVEHVVRAAREAGAARIAVVVGHGAELVRTALAPYGVEFALQSEQLGTGHALRVGLEALEGWDGPAFALNGDGALVTAATLRALLDVQGDGPGMTLMTIELPDPTGLGRVIRARDGAVERIVEEKDATPEQRRVTEVSPGFFLFDATARDKAAALSNDNAQGEYYITDLPAAYLAEGAPVRAVRAPDPREGLAANDRVQLAGLERAFRDRIRERWMREGVTMIAPETTFIDDEVVLGRDVVLEPGCLLRGRSYVHDGARVGAYAVLRDCEVAPGAVVPPHRIATGERFA